MISRLKKVVLKLLDYIFDVRVIIDDFIGRENLYELREDCKGIFLEEVNNEEIGEDLDYRKIAQWTDIYRSMAQTNLTGAHLTLVFIGFAIYFLWGIKWVSLYAALFGLEIIIRSHVIDVISYYNIFESESKKEILFKNHWNSKALGNILLFEIMWAALCRRWIPSWYEGRPERIVRKIAER